MTDPLLRMLENLPQAEPDRIRAARVRARCHAALARDRLRGTARRTDGPRPSGALLIGLGGAYLIETIRQALFLFGFV